MDVWMYLCVGSFKYLETKTYQRLTGKFVFPLYLLCQVGGLLAILSSLVKVWRRERNAKKTDEEVDHSNTSPDWLKTRPELAYHLIQTVFFGAMAISTLRMKFLWTPYMCVLGSTLVTERQVYNWILNYIRKYNQLSMEVLRHAVCAAVICALYYTCMGGIREELNNFREFYDPDTVQLMQWISANTPRDAAFSGSMQLLAGVKLSTGRPITNHPHYEDRTLRHTTKQIYQIYGRKPAHEVHAILKQYKTSYIIVEDSICTQPATDQCGTPSLIDMHNGVTTLKDDIQDGIEFTTEKKFCDQIRSMKPPYDSYFKEVFKNRTFRIYKVLYG